MLENPIIHHAVKKYSGAFIIPYYHFLAQIKSGLTLEINLNIAF